MSPISFVITLIILGVLLWLVNTYPMARPIKIILNVVLVIGLILWLLAAVAVFTGISA